MCTVYLVPYNTYMYLGRYTPSVRTSTSITDCHCVVYFVLRMSSTAKDIPSVYLYTTYDRGQDCRIGWLASLNISAGVKKKQSRTSHHQVRPGVQSVYTIVHYVHYCARAMTLGPPHDPRNENGDTAYCPFPPRTNWSYAMCALLSFSRHRYL